MSADRRAGRRSAATRGVIAAPVAAVVRSTDHIAPVFAALGDPTRLKLVALLCASGTLSIAQLTSSTDITRQAVTKHLQVLAGAGVVHDVRRGRERRWQLDAAQLIEARRTLDVIGSQWQSALDRLKAYAESD